MPEAPGRVTLTAGGAGLRVPLLPLAARSSARCVTELNKGVTPKTVTVVVGEKSFKALLRIDTPGEADYYRHGGIMQYVLRSLLN